MATWWVEDRKKFDRNKRDRFPNLTPARYPPNLNNSTLMDGLVSTFNEDGVDLMSVNHLTGLNTPTTSTGKVRANAMQFTRNQSEDYYLPDAGAADFEPSIDEYALSFWFKIDTLFNYITLYSKGAGTQYRTYTQANGDLITQHAGVTCTQGAASVTNGTWHHFYMDWVEESATQRVLLDATTFVTNTGSAGVSNPVDFRIGSNGGQHYVGGAIDQFSLWHRRLSDAEITELYAGGDGFDFFVAP